MKRQFKFTKKLLDALPPCPADSKSSEVEFSDTDVAGLRIVVNRLGRRYFMLRYNFQERKRSMKLGDYPGALDIGQARERALELRAQLAKGVDPQAIQIEVVTQRGLTLAEFMVQDFLPYSKLANRSWKDSLGRWRIHLLPAFGDVVMKELKTQDIQLFHDRKRIELCAGSANRILALLKRALNLSLLWEKGGLLVNPVRGVRMHFENNQRTRHIAVGDELRRFLTALEHEPNRTAANYLKFLLATGVRRTEGLTCRFSDVSMTEARWLLSTTKNGRSRFVILNSVALEILKEQRQRTTGAWVFPANGQPDKHLADPKKAFQRACKHAELEPGLVIHSLRHSFCSQLVQSGLSLQVVQNLVGHRQISTTARYSHLAEHQLHEAASRVSAAMDAAMR